MKSPHSRTEYKLWSISKQKSICGYACMSVLRKQWNDVLQKVRFPSLNTEITDDFNFTIFFMCVCVLNFSLWACIGYEHGGKECWFLIRGQGSQSISGEAVGQGRVAKVGVISCLSLSNTHLPHRSAGTILFNR